MTCALQCQIEPHFSHSLQQFEHVRIGLAAAEPLHGAELRDAQQRIDAGEAPSERLRSTIRECDLDGAVRITGYLEDAEVSASLMAADVVALPFTYGISLESGSLLAAMAHGRAVVATQPRVADPRLTPGGHLVCVPPRESESIAAAILGLLNDPIRRRHMAQAGASTARPFD
jgi:glycosyltransferase involved in cell wall biosynthesis